MMHNLQVQYIIAMSVATYDMSVKKENLNWDDFLLIKLTIDYLYSQNPT